MKASNSPDSTLERRCQDVITLERLLKRFRVPASAAKPVWDQVAHVIGKEAEQDDIR